MVNNNLSFDECKQMSRRLIAMNPNRNANMGKIPLIFSITTPSLPSSLGSAPS